jgi:O-antigen/teichoic acid export membrane protein
MIKSFQINFKEYLQSNFLKHIFIVATGTAFAQAIGVISSPVLSRIFNPEHFGGLALFVTLTSLLISISSLGYESATVLPKENNDAANIVVLSSILSFISFLVILFLVLLAKNSLLHRLEINENDRIYYYFIPFVVLINSIANSFVFWNNRLTNFKVNSYYRVLQSLSIAILSIVFGWLDCFSNGLIVSFLIGNILFSTLFIIYTCNKSFLNESHISKANMVVQAKKYIEFPKVYLVLNFFDSLRENVFVFMIGSHFSMATLGAYSFAMRIVRMPLNLISSSVSQVAYQKISKLKNDNGNVSNFLYKLIFMLAAISIPIALVFVFFGPQLFAFIFGQQWAVTGHYTKILSVWLCANFVSSPIATIPLIFGKPRFSFYYTLAFNIIGIIVFYLTSVITNDFEVSLLLTSIASAVYLLFYIVQIVRLVNKNK